MDLHIKISAHEDPLEGHKVETDRNHSHEFEYQDVNNGNEREKTFDDYLKDVDFEKYLDDPDYFIKIVVDTDATEKRRINIKTKPWQTRFMNIGNNSKTIYPPTLPVVDSVRTHLR